jgi:hypothetical protein
MAASYLGVSIDHCTCAHQTLCTCHYANGTINEKYKWGNLAECQASCHSSAARL